MNIFLKKAEDISANADTYIQEIAEETADYEIKKCYETGSPFSLSLTKNLSVQVIKHPEVKKNTRVCSGHWKKGKHYWKKEAKEDEDAERKRLSQDPTVMKFDVQIKNGSGMLKHYKVTSDWWHYDNAKTCDAFQWQEKKFQEQRNEEIDSWVFENENEILNTPQCTFIGKDCLEPSVSKLINGEQIFRQCWKEKWNYLCKYDRKKGCQFLANQNCTLIHKDCLEKNTDGCSLWELSYKCLSNIQKKFKKLDDKEMFGSQEEEWDTALSPNTSFSNVFSTLSVFEAIKQDMENSQLSNDYQLQIFKGKKFKCGVNVSAGLMYDCCFSFGGLTNTLKLSHCNTDELSLGEMREKGLCYYLGYDEKKILDLLTTRKEHIFCCFSTKLARVFQEQAREQLQIDWGTPQHADCRGLSSDEIAKLDFTRLDLSEAYEKLPDTTNLERKTKDKAKFEEKAENIQNKLKARLSQ
ncbi:conjugal transfer mating pair stabilisation protein TraN [Parachlamydia acanthamoebae UV-7]|uniref:Conjugal transfer mating pair stabilisation protein TraN n=2 Tax=Parachlamydia acanthamoebae TaxID=83552 RepID=F8L035_PARAV|nr:conjugal transfer protein TraN [Parachlamydia acanthamoebae]EFB40746.1 putative conjugative pilus assembly protein TraN [Parachlamydia acanthamoebae str. Hall's coccus]CCB86555.1 conjugal transfer mating pair stabilisation protein TraN [Parachlamydia acanthamoebae UV-7]